tara:strand:- start:765 stop:911 length:147 start_codon:yes stop_codon:yes gene_type:complete
MNKQDLKEIEKALILCMPNELAIVDVYGDEAPSNNIKNIMRIMGEKYN